MTGDHFMEFVWGDILAFFIQVQGLLSVGLGILFGSFWFFWQLVYYFYFLLG